MKMIQYLNKTLYNSVTGFLLLSFFLFTSAANVNAQIQVMRVYGTDCVGAQNVFALVGGSCSASSWYVSGGNYTIISQNSSSLSVRWNSPVSNVVVSASYSCSSYPYSGVAYSPSVTITNAVTPSVSITASANNVCQGTNVTFTASPVNGGSSPYYSWRVNGTTVSSGSSRTFSRAVNNGEVIDVVMSSNAPCVTSSTATSNNITMTTTTPSPVSVSVSGPSTICSGSSSNASFMASVTNGGSNPVYAWYKNGVPVSDQLSGPPPYVYVPTNPLNNGDRISCRVTSNASCVSNNPATSNEFTVSLTPSTTPSVGISIPKLNFCSGENITFGATGSYLTGSSSYVWRLNGTQISTSSSVTLPVTTDTGAPNAFSPGDVVTLNVSGLSGTCLSSTSASASTSNIPFVISPVVTPSVNLTLSTSNLCLPGSITLTATPTNGGSSPTYTFYIDGAQVASGTSNTYTTSSSAGSHSAYVVMTSNAACRSANTATSPTRNFTVASKSSFSVKVNGPSQICSNQTSSVGFYASIPNVTGTIGNLSYQWYKNGSLVSGATSNPFITDVVQGTKVHCVVTSDYWCVTSPVTSDTYTVNLTPSVTPTVGIQIPKITFCTGETITFAATGSYITASSTYSWKLNGSQFSTASSTSLPVSTDTNAPNTFSPGDVVTVTVTGLSGTCLNSNSATGTTSGIPFTIYPLPNATTNPAGNVVVCSTCSQNITASSGTGYSYQWKFNNSPVAAPAGTANPYTASNAGTYVVEITANGCKKTSPAINLSKNSKPVANAGPDKTLTLPTNSVILNGSGSDADGTITAYTWTKVSGPAATLSNANTASLSLSDLVAGIYVFRLTVRDNFPETGSDDVRVTVNYPANNYNWIKETTVRVSGQTTEAQVQALSAGQKNVAWQYFDGIGRPMQSVIMQGSPLQKDVVQPVVYDEYGRENKKYLPVVVNESNGYYKRNADIIDAATGSYKGIAAGFYAHGSDNKIADDSRPYAESFYEASPEKRILKDYGAGQAWYDQVNNVFKPIEYEQLVYVYGTSAGQERVIAWTINASGLPVRNTSINGGTGYYPTGALFIKSTKDENGNQAREYTDKAGKLILKKVQATTSASDLNSTTDWAQTYYIYDDFGNMRYVLQPELVKTLAQSATLNPTQANLDALAFQYKFDGLQRTIEKKSPGADPLYFVYDKRGRVVMTQDGNQRKDASGNITKKEWTYTKYDELNRPVITGIYTHGSVVDRATMEGLISTTNFTESYNGDPATFGYTNTVFPTTNYKVSAVTYYDDYRFRDDLAGAADYGYTPNDITGQATANPDVLGFVTGTFVNVLGTSDYLWTVNYYDYKYRKLQVKSQNYKGGIDRVTHLYDFVQVKETKTVHSTSSNAYTVHKKFDYDHVGRVLKNWHKFNTMPDFVLLSQNEFNELGELVGKKLHSRNGSSFIQNVDYRYTIRGWLEKINDISNPEAADLFNLDLKYLQPSAGISSQFNGNITEAVWKSAGGDLLSYGYEYDVMNRMIAANFFNKNRPLHDGRYTERVGDGTTARPAYDLNGNIKNLLRYGKKSANTFGLIDDLRYKTWSGNQVLQIDDAQADNSFDDPFKEGTTEQASEYAYDANGNFKKDANKGIISIEYNHLNLPAKVSKSATEYVTYTYDAAGRKIKQEVFGTTPKKTEYLGEFVYENNNLVFVSHEEGRIVPDNSPGAPRPWEYQYFIKDHLGNVRVVFSEKKTTTEYKATLETSTQTTEQSTFRNYSRNGFPLFNHTVGAGSTYSQLLNAGHNSQIGLAKSFEVNPGDMFDLEVYAKYEEPTSTGANVNTLLAALSSAFSLGTSTTPLESPQAQTAFNNLFSGGGPWITDSRWEDDVAPKAYLNYILFDQNFQLVDFGFDQISLSAKQVGASPVVPHDYLNLHVRIKQKGYLYVYLSNEQPVQTNVYFDDLKITHQTGVEQVTDYYPFGAAIASLSFTRPGSVNNPFGYNGREIQDEMNLGWLDYGLRMYMPDIGRWGAQDPYSQKMAMVSPYAYSLNNPVLYQDKDGAIPIIPLLIKAGANGAADLFLQVVMNYYFDDKDITVAEAFDNVNWWQVGRSALEGLIPWKGAGRLGRAAGTAVGDVMVNAFNQGSNYTADQALQDFAVGFLGDLAGGGLGELINKYGSKGFARGLTKIFGKDESIEYVWKYVDPQLRGTVFEHMLAETRYKGYTHTFSWSETFPAIDFWKDGKGISLKTTDAKSGFGNIIRNIKDLAKAREAGHIRGKKITEVELHIGVPDGYNEEDLRKVLETALEYDISVTIFFIR